MAEIDITAVIFLISFFLIFGIFLLYDLFRKGQNYGYFAYFLACLPANYIWVLSSTIENIDVLTAYLVLFLLWDACLIRDFFFTVKDEKNHMATLLFLSMGVLVQLIVTTILPAPNCPRTSRKLREDVVLLVSGRLYCRFRCRSMG